MPEAVRITEVAPRDGLQNEPGVVPTADKAALVRALAESGADEIEVTSFVSPKWVPQLGDAAELFGLLAADRPEGVTLSALVPNETGMRRAIETNARAGGGLIGKVAVFTAASETFSRKNTNAGIAETLDRFGPVMELARGEGLPVRGYVSCAVACPYEGPIRPEAVGDVVTRLLELGCDEIDLGDTIGEAVPDTLAAVLLDTIERLDGRRLNDRGDPMLTLHLHDTFGRAAECVREALTLGVRSFDASAGGLGGCPFASTAAARAPGNIATSVLLRTLESEGFTSNIDPSRLAHASALAERLVTDARAAEAAGESSEGPGR